MDLSTISSAIEEIPDQDFQYEEKFRVDRSKLEDLINGQGSGKILFIPLYKQCFLVGSDSV